MIGNIKIQNNIGCRFIFWAAASFIYLLVFARYTSPLTEATGVDFDMFVMGGAVWKDGVVYTDYFDNKGPYLFFINYLGLLLSDGKWGVFLLEVVNLSVVLELLYRIAKVFKASTSRIAISIFLFLILFACTINDGDTVEFWSLPWVLISLLLAVKSIAEKRNLSSNHIFAIGICMGIVTFLRVNDAAIIVGIVLWILIQRVIDGNGRSPLSAIAYFLLGWAAGMAPAIVWFAINGALSEMLYATVWYNIKYRAYFNQYLGYRGMAQNALFMLSAFILPILSYRYDKRSSCRSFLLMLIICVATFFTFIYGRSFGHYFTMCLPLAFMIPILGKDTRNWITTTLIIIISLPYLQWSYSEIGMNFRILYSSLCDSKGEGLVYDIEKRNKVYDSFVKKNIPTADRENVYTLDIPYYIWGIYYFTQDKLPVGKYFCQQSSIANIDPENRKDDIINKFIEANPNWIVSGEIMDNSVLNEFTADYCKIDSIDIPLQPEYPGVDVKLYMYKKID